MMVTSVRCPKRTRYILVQSANRRHKSSPHRPRIALKLPRMYASLPWEYSLPRFRAVYVGGLYLEVSLAT